MANVNLSDQLKKRIGTTTEKGTKITEGLVEKVRGDEAGNLVIIEDNREQVEHAINQAIAAALEECGLAAERFAKAKCPVDTGRLRNSITQALDLSDEAVYVGTNVEYAPYQEFGTHGRDGKHFLRDAANGHGAYYSGIVKKHLQSG